MKNSDNSTEGGEYSDEQLNDVTKITLITAYVLILLFSIMGNSLVIHIVRTRTNIRKNSFNWLLTNVAISDLVDVTTASAFIVPYFLCGACWISGILGTILCKILPFFLLVSICSSVWTLTVIAIDRYLAIACIRRKPLSNKSVVSSIICVWLCASLIFSGQLYKFKTEELEDGTSTCSHEWHEDWEISTVFYKTEMIVRVVITYAVPLIIIAVLYSLIALLLSRHKPPGNVNFNQQAYAKQARNRRAVNKMIVTAITVFALCWLPVHVCHIISIFYPEAYDNIPAIPRFLFYWLAHANAAIHPWLFIIFSENLRVETSGIIRNIWKTI